MWLDVAARMDTQETCVLKGLDYAQDVIYVVHSIANIIGGGVWVYMIVFNEHDDFHFDKEQDVCMISAIYERIGYNSNMVL
jgi:hypothetical protein